MEIKVLFFARSKELAGTGEATFNLPEGGTTTSLLQAVMQQVSEVIHEIEGRHPADVAVRALSGDNLHNSPTCKAA